MIRARVVLQFIYILNWNWNYIIWIALIYIFLNNFNIKFSNWLIVALISVGGDTPAAQFSGGDDETENEDQVDHVVYNNGFPTYLNFRTGLPKGDFSFGENELDMEIDSLSSGETRFI